jgi:hypothetical protein
MATLSATTSSAKSIVKLNIMIKYALQLREAAAIILDICNSFWVWHPPSVIYERVTPEIAEIVCEFFGDVASFEKDTVTVTGLFTEDDECT